jgi:hypothetical protein
MNDFVYGIGSGCLIAGCIRNQFKKSGLNVFLEFLGFGLMMVAYIIKW